MPSNAIPCASPAARSRLRRPAISPTIRQRPRRLVRVLSPVEYGDEKRDGSRNNEQRPIHDGPVSNIGRHPRNRSSLRRAVADSRRSVASRTLHSGRPAAKPRTPPAEILEKPDPLRVIAERTSVASATARPFSVPPALQHLPQTRLAPRLEHGARLRARARCPGAVDPAVTASLIPSLRRPRSPAPAEPGEGRKRAAGGIDQAPDRAVRRLRLGGGALQAPGSRVEGPLDGVRACCVGGLAGHRLRVRPG